MSSPYRSNNIRYARISNFYNPYIQALNPDDPATLLQRVRLESSII
jgi:hypothetical protein